MKILPWLKIDSKHPFYRSGKMDFLELFPSTSTQIWLKNHRNYFRTIDQSFILSCKVNANGIPEIESQNLPQTLHFYLGTKDVNFSIFTDCEDKPLHSHSFHFNVDVTSNFEPPINLNLKDAELKQEIKSISLPSGFYKMGELRINIPEISSFIKKGIENGPITFNIESQTKAYQLIFAIDKTGNQELMPTEILDEADIATFEPLNVDNSRHHFFASTGEISIEKLNSIECVPYRIHEDKSRTKLKCRVPRFGLSNISKSPSYPHLPVLLQEIKY
jgi:hypothetical protein